MSVTLPGTGNVVATETIAGEQVQLFKPMLGAPGVNDGPVSDSNPMPVNAFNVTSKFREAFEGYDPVGGGKWLEVKGTNDLVFVDGNALAASYLVVSKSPLNAGTETTIETVADFDLPVEVAFGLSMSQATLGQEASVEIVDTDAPLADVPDIAISAITQATTTLTVTTTDPHGLVPGKAIGIRGCSTQQANYPALVVASIPSPNQFTATAGPGGTIPSQTITNPAGAKGFVYFRERFGRSRDGAALIFENASVTQASAYVRSDSGDALPSGTALGSHVITVGTRASVQVANTAYTNAFAPTTEYRALIQADRVQWADAPVDTTSAMTNRLVRTQVTPSASKRYKFRLRVTNNKSLSTPVAQIITATKAGTTTATVTTDVPHGLAAGDLVVAYGVRDQTNFANLVTATAVASIVSPTQFTIVWGAAVTATTFGGYVAAVRGGNLLSALGASAVVAQGAILSTLSDGTRQLVLTGNSNWTGLLIGDLVDLIGARNTIDGSSIGAGIDGPWKVANVATAALTLVLPVARTIPADFGSINCGGGVIKRTDVRLSFVRVFDFDRLRVEQTPRPAGDAAAAQLVALASNSVSLTSTTVAGTVAIDAAVGNPVTAGARAANANPTAMSANGDNVAVLATMIGAPVVKPYAIPEAEWIASVALTTTGDVPLVAAAAAGIKRHLTWLHMKNTGASPIDVLIKDGTTTRLTFTLNAGEGELILFPTGGTQPTALTALNAQLSAAGTVRINAGGYTAP